MNGINSKDRFSFAKGYRARTIFLIFDILLLGILMCMMVLPLLKVIVDSIDPTSYGVRLWPRKIDFSAYEMILTTSSLWSLCSPPLSVPLPACSSSRWVLMS